MSTGYSVGERIMWQQLPATDTVMCVEFTQPTMNAQVRKPTMRVCEECERAERWDEDLEAWQLVREDGERLTGNPHCIHEWDINGSFNPMTGTINGA